jgi:ABC-type multidrug transport system fused ATPase/permease subunit
MAAAAAPRAAAAEAPEGEADAQAVGRERAGDDAAAPGAAEAAAAAARLASEHSAGPLSRALFVWVGALIARGSSSKLRLEDLFELWPEDRADALTAADAAFCAGCAAAPTLQARLVHAMRRHMMLASLCRALYVGGQCAFPMLLRRLVAAVALQEPVGNCVLWACVLACVSTTGAVAEQQHQHLAMRAGRRGRSLAVALVFRQCVSLSTAALSHRDPGDIANLLSNDAQRLLVYAPLVAQLWSSPVQIAISTYLLIRILGVRALAGVGMLLAMMPLLTALANLQRRLRAAHMTAGDARVRLCGEAARGMRGLKFANWDRAFLERILTARAAEQRLVRLELLVTAATISVAIVLPQLATAATFAAAVVPSHSALHAADAFAALSLFNVLRFPLMNLGEAVAGSAQARVSVERLSSLLAIDEPVRSAAAADAAKGAKDVGVVAEGAAFWWPQTPGGPPAVVVGDAAKADSPDTSEFRLRGVTLRVAPGELLAVVGPVGSGKSTLLAGLLGESCGEGAVALRPRGGVAYAAQSPFLLNGTLRDNVLFGRPFDAQRYAAAIAACCLAPDVAALPARDATVLGERGVTLSGGQRARVSLARALYGDPAVLLLDDVLSALDADTGRAVFAAALGPVGMARRSARVLVTHATQYLGQATAVAVLDGGALAACGTHAALLAAAAAGDAGGLSPGARAQLAAVGVQEKLEERRASTDRRQLDAASAALRVPDKADGRLGEEEEQDQGSASWVAISAYVRALGGAPWAVTQFLLLLCERTTYLSTDYMLTTWTAAAHGPPDTVFGRLMHSPASTGLDKFRGLSPPAFYACAYLLCCAVNAVFAAARTVWFTTAGARAAGRLFIGAATAVMRSPLLFFETTPTGRILNRLCADQDVLDSTLPLASLRLTSSVAWLLSSLAIMCGVVPPAALPVGLALCAYVWRVSRFTAAYAQLQRLEANSRTPLQVHVQEALTGAATVRAYGATARFIAACDTHCDNAAAASTAFAVAGRWFSVRLEAAAGCILVSVGIACAVLRSSIGGSMAGLALIWAANFSLALTFFTQALTDFQSRIVSVERIHTYCSLPPEPPWEVAEHAAPASWPREGRVEFAAAVLRYRPELPPALNGLSFSVAPGERLGIVGRTGAGKSTIAAALLRLRDLCSGAITLDGLDLARMGLADVRRGVCAIPQEPLLLTGSLRANLDPSGALADAEVWDALRAVRMAQPVAALAGGLDAPVADAGTNFSVGERQLLCFARALLRRPRVLLLDEATASCDEVSDAAIQLALRASFADVTVMAIAHRLLTVVDYDKILVVASGAAAECDSPATLLEQPQGALTALVAALGPAAAAHLRSVAAAAKAKPQAAASTA